MLFYKNDLLVGLTKAPSFCFPNPGSYSHTNTDPDPQHLLVIVLLFALMYAAAPPCSQNCHALAGVTHKNPQYSLWSDACVVINYRTRTKQMQRAGACKNVDLCVRTQISSVLVKREQAQQVMKLWCSKIVKNLSLTWMSRKKKDLIFKNWENLLLTWMSRKKKDMSR